MPNASYTPDVTETGATIPEKPKTPSKKIRYENIKTIIEDVITPTEATHATETQVTALALQDLIVQQIDKNATPVPDAAVYHTISANAILH